MGFGLIRVVNKKMEFLQLNELNLKKYEDHYLKLKLIFERTTELIDTHHPDEIAIEAPFFGKNVQSMLKLGRAQGVATQDERAGIRGPSTPRPVQQLLLRQSGRKRPTDAAHAGLARRCAVAVSSPSGPEPFPPSEQNSQERPWRACHARSAQAVDIRTISGVFPMVGCRRGCCADTTARCSD